MSDGMALVLRCTECGATEVRNVTTLQARPNMQHWFKPQPCGSCQREAAEPTARAYVLGHNDRKFLKSMRIRPDDLTPSS